MANNRLYLKHKASGYVLFLAKRMGWGWYRSGSIDKALSDFLFKCERDWGKEEDVSQDQFELLLEDNSDVPEIREITEDDFGKIIRESDSDPGQETK